jgi:hypothetical protein
MIHTIWYVSLYHLRTHTQYTIDDDTQWLVDWMKQELNELWAQQVQYLTVVFMTRRAYDSYYVICLILTSDTYTIDWWYTLIGWLDGTRTSTSYEHNKVQYLTVVFMTRCSSWFILFDMSHYIIFGHIHNTQWLARWIRWNKNLNELWAQQGTVFNCCVHDSL